MRKLQILIFQLIILAVVCNSIKAGEIDSAATKDDGTWLILSQEDVSGGTYHTNHAESFGKYVTGYNDYILKATDSVQARAMDGGGYFTGIKAEPTESPIGYNLSLLNRQLLEAPRTTSYCSGSTYSAFIEAINLIYKSSLDKLSDDRFESLRMQEPDGGRREDGIKFWGKWNDDGYGNHFALVQYSGMGRMIDPVNARPGDFLNISWKHGGGHSVIFLGWYVNDDDEKCVVYWSSQKSTNGLGDAIVPISKIREVMFVRLASPDNLFTFDVNKKVDRSVKGSEISW